MNFADELRKNLKSEQQVTLEEEKTKNDKRQKSLELLKVYVVDLVKKEAVVCTKHGIRSMEMIPRYHYSGKWGAMSTDIGCFHTTNYRYEQKQYIEQKYTGGLDFFVHFNDFDYFSSLCYKELEKCGFEDIKVSFVKHYEKDDNLIFKGKFKYCRLKIKVSW